MSPFPFHIHGAAGTWPFPTKYTSKSKHSRILPNPPAGHRTTPGHLEAGGNRKGQWIVESGLPNGKERTECERQGQQQPLVETCRLTARKLAASPTRKWGKQTRQLVECQVPLKRLERFQMIAICSGAQWSLVGGQRFTVRLRPGRLAQSQSSQCSLCLDADGSFHSPHLLFKAQ